MFEKSFSGLTNLSQDGTSAFSEISDESQCERAECGPRFGGSGARVGGRATENWLLETKKNIYQIQMIEYSSSILFHISGGRWLDGRLDEHRG